MGIAEIDAKGARRVDPRVHARQDEVLLRRRQGDVALRERRRVLRRAGLDVLLDRRHIYLAFFSFFLVGDVDADGCRRSFSLKLARSAGWLFSPFCAGFKLSPFVGCHRSTKTR